VFFLWAEVEIFTIRRTSCIYEMWPTISSAVCQFEMLDASELRIQGFMEAKVGCRNFLGKINCVQALHSGFLMLKWKNF
jgi:hypothetical protein